MSYGGTAAVRSLACLTLLLSAAAGAANDASFQLSAGFDDLPDYFPGYLANGYLSTLTAPRGTEATRAYLAGFMDYAAGDMSRPAAIPAWTEIDFNPGAAAERHGWLNRAALDVRHFSDYRQTLDLRAATLTTSYRYADRGRTTAIEVSTLVSEASAHLAATTLRITPDYDGTVQLSFALLLWAQYAPRFPLAQMSGAEIEEAVAAQGLSLEAQPPATADRAAVWYPGYTEVQAREGESASLSLWLEGQAVQGLSMAMAATVALPQGVPTAQVSLRKDRYRLALDVSMKVERGHTYAFTKYVAVSRSGWGGGAAEDLRLARGAREAGFSCSLVARASPCGGSSSCGSTGNGGVAILLVVDPLDALRVDGRFAAARGGRSAVALLPASRFREAAVPSISSPRAVDSGCVASSASLGAALVFPVFAAFGLGRSPSRSGGGLWRPSFSSFLRSGLI